MTAKRPVPLSRPLGNGTVGHHPALPDNVNPVEPVSLRTLAHAVLMRDRRRDNTRDNTLQGVPLSHISSYGTVGQFLPELPKAWSYGFQKVCHMTPPIGILPSRWAQIAVNTDHFLTKHGADAARLGWTTLDLFGVGGDAPDHRIDLMGLVPLIGGAEVLELSEKTARLRTVTGSIQTFYRKPAQAGRVTLWELEGPA